MEPRTCRNSCSLKAPDLCLLFICLLFATVPALASNDSHVVIRENVSAAKREELASKLRAITGWPSLDFDDYGALRLGSRNSNKGSQSARDLLTRAVKNERFVVIEDASSRADVAFCRVVAAKLSRDVTNKFEAFVVLIDFSDFQKVMGDSQARSAFDVGWGFLHELDHVMHDSEDAKSSLEVGDCEQHINTMRQQLGLPIRVDYFFSSLPTRSNPSLVSNFVRLRFEQRGFSNKIRHYWLIWDAALVGGLPEERQTASIRYPNAFRQ